MSLEIKHLHVTVEAKEILQGLSLNMKKGEVHCIMGPNGSGKSTLANVLMGHPKYKVTAGEVILDEQNILELKPEKRAQAGLFLSMQYAPEIMGVTITNFLRLAFENRTGEKQNPVKFYKMLTEKMQQLNIAPSFAGRSLNVGFSGGEKKKMDILQLLLLNPTYAILDETDSGLDVDALRIVAEGINSFRSPEKGILMITHYNRLLEYVVPDFVHVMVDGEIVKSGGKELAAEIEKNGYERIFNL